MSEEKILIKNILKKKKKKKKHLEKLNTQQGAVNISNQPNPRTNKNPIIAIDNYNNTLKEYDSIYAASKDLQINSGIIIYSCKTMYKPKKRYTFCYKYTLRKKYINILYRRDG